MMKDYIFHYNNDCANDEEEVEPGEYTYHESLLHEDGKHCRVDLEAPHAQGSAKPCFEAYFDDGSELSVWREELEEV